MEFSRRGPATDGHRCPDPPPHGDAMLVMSDALLLQLQKNRLRHEIIVAELAKIERSMALRAVSMPRHGMQQCRGPANGWDLYGDVGETLHNVKLPENDGQQGTEYRSWKPAMEDRIDGCWNPCRCRGTVGQQNIELDEPKLQDSSETVPPNKKSLAVKWELTGTTILVKKPKPLMKWSYAVCQVPVSSEQNLQMHFTGKKHKSKIATLESRIKAISGQKTRTVSEPSPGTDQIKTLSVKWSCSTCQANGTCQSDLEEHLKGTNHQKNITASSKEGSNNDTAKNMAPYEAKSHESNVSQHTEKPPSVGSCNIFQTICCCKSDLEIRALDKQCKNMAVNSESQKENLDPNGMAPHSEKMNGELDMESHLRDERHQVMCEAKCNSEPQFEHHCESRNHKQKINVILREGDIAKVSSLHIKAACKEGSNIDLAKNIVSQEENSHDSNVPEHAEKPPSVRSCSICQGICNCKADSETDPMCRRRIQASTIRKYMVALARNSEPLKTKLIPNGMPQHAEELNWESHLRDKRHQLNVQALPGKNNKEKNNLPQIAKDQQPSPEVECADVCEAKCNSKPQFDHTAKAEKINAILREGNIVKVSGLHIESTCKGNRNDMSKDIVSLEGKSQESDVLEHAPSVQSCSICQGICNCESDLDVRAITRKYKMMALDSESLKAKLIPNGVPKHTEKMNGELDLESHQLNVQALSEKNIQRRNNPPEIAMGQTSPSEWHCAMCQAKCQSKAQFENHCTSGKYQRKIKVQALSEKTSNRETIHQKLQRAKHHPRSGIALCARPNANLKLSLRITAQVENINGR